MTTERVRKIKQLLTRELAPEHLEVLDQGHLHEGHPGARDGRGHFDVTIISKAFAGQSIMKRHRMVYAALGEMMTTDIHALSIKAGAPEK